MSTFSGVFRYSVIGEDCEMLSHMIGPDCWQLSVTSSVGSSNSFPWYSTVNDATSLGSFRFRLPVNSLSGVTTSCPVTVRDGLGTGGFSLVSLVSLATGSEGFSTATDVRPNKVIDVSAASTVNG